MTEKKHGEGRRRTLKSDAEGNGKTPGVLVGLDIGYGFTKILREDEQRLMFPSAVAAIPPTILSSISDMHAEDEVVVERVRCIVGERTIGKDDRYSNLHNVWWTSTPYKAIIAQAKKWIPARSSIVTGLPPGPPRGPASNERPAADNQTGVPSISPSAIPSSPSTDNEDSPRCSVRSLSSCTHADRSTREECAPHTANSCRARGAPRDAPERVPC